MTFKAFLSRVTSWALLAFAALMWCSACVASVERDSSEDIAEAQEAIGFTGACGPRYTCPTPLVCDASTMLCRSACDAAGACPDSRDQCWNYVCGHGICRPVTSPDGATCNQNGGNECLAGTCQ